MSYSHIIFKTTTEGYVTMLQLNKFISKPAAKLFTAATVSRSEAGFYKIEFDWIEWSDHSPLKMNYQDVMRKLGRLGIPYKLIRIGEQPDDCEEQFGEAFDGTLPDEILELELLHSVDDPEEDCSYEPVDPDADAG